MYASWLESFTDRQLKPLPKATSGSVARMFRLVRASTLYNQSTESADVASAEILKACRSDWDLGRK